MTSFTADDLAEVVDDLASRPRVADRLDVPGLDPRRADIILGGVLVLEQVFEALGIDEMVVSDYALREGVLLDVAAPPAGRHARPPARPPLRERPAPGRPGAGREGALRTDRRPGRSSSSKAPVTCTAFRTRRGVARGGGLLRTWGWSSATTATTSTATT